MEFVKLVNIWTSDIFLIIKTWLIANASCDRRMENYDHIMWKNYMNGLSPEMKKWIVESPAIYLGMDIDKLSSQLMLKLMRTVNINDNMKDYDFYSFNGPIHEMWFEPWIKYLQMKGVNFHFNTEITSINIENRKIESIKVKKIEDSFEEILINDADYYINSLSIKVLQNYSQKIKLKIPF